MLVNCLYFPIPRPRCPVRECLEVITKTCSCCLGGSGRVQCVICRHRDHSVPSPYYGYYYIHTHFLHFHILLFKINNTHSMALLASSVSDVSLLLTSDRVTPEYDNCLWPVYLVFTMYLDCMVSPQYTILLTRFGLNSILPAQNSIYDAFFFIRMILNEHRDDKTMLHFLEFPASTSGDINNKD